MNTEDLGYFGKGTTQGLGYYEIYSPDRRIITAEPQYDKAISYENLSRAHEEVLSDNDEHYTDRESIDLDDLARRLGDGLYEPSPLTGVVIPKADGSFRFLAVPCITDRIVQRAVLNVIRPAVEATFEESSYAYRLARSRYSAAGMIETLRAQGYTYVVDADISRFFDSIDHNILFRKAEAVIADGRLMALIKKWVRADVIFNNVRITRERGVPQGMVLSPILSNIYLDEFDEKMEECGYRLIRYADDFLILCRDKELMIMALEDAARILRELRLDISQEKSELTDFAHGFDYLGFLFLNSLVLERKKDGKDKKNKKNPIQKPDNELVWTALEKLGYKRQDVRKAEHFVSADSIGRVSTPTIRTVWLETPGSQALKSSGYLRVTSYGTELASIPLSQIEQIIVGEGVWLSPGMVNHCLKSGLPVIYLDTFGRCLGRLGSVQSDRTDLWEKQLIKSHDPQFCARFAAEIIHAKISNLREIIRRHKIKDAALESLWINMGGFLKRLATTSDSKAVRGLEGGATAEYFKYFSLLIDHRLPFGYRTRRPPRDPVNVMLSFGYTVLYNNIYTLVEKASLSPFIGFFHMRKSGHGALVSDLIEPFRFLVDQTVIRLVNRGQMAAGHFLHDAKGKYPCRLTQAGRRIFITELENKLNEEVLFGEKKIDWRRVMDLQVFHLKRMITDETSSWEAFRLRP